MVHQLGSLFTRQLVGGQDVLVACHKSLLDWYVAWAEQVGSACGLLSYEETENSFCAE